MDARRFNCRKKEYVPGESGELAARSDFAGRTGLQKKSILVVTKDTINEPVILRLLVTIPEAVSVEPGVVFWRPGSKRIILWKTGRLTTPGRRCGDWASGLGGLSVLLLPHCGIELMRTRRKKLVSKGGRIQRKWQKKYCLNNVVPGGYDRQPSISFQRA
ncbi:MAG: hypothetical protein JO151_04725 [Verrucomicrobia bacterium]|nr:hypothetical protein [Verrucomicrobiota bacterium]